MASGAVQTDMASETARGRLRDTIDQQIASGELNPDPAQDEAIARLDAILDALSAPSLANKKSALGWLFGKNKKSTATPVRGLYLWGGVGRGKSMLMDSFFELAPTEPKRRVHFHAFMQDVHERIHEWRQNQKSKDKNSDRDGKKASSDPIAPLADELAKEAQLLCFDEFAVTDVADAMILARLFTALLSNGVVVVATSNVEPDLLYKNGLNRSFFLPFIELVKEKLTVLELVSDTDHRMEILINESVYFVDDKAGFELLWQKMTANAPIAPALLEIKGRQQIFKRASDGLVRETFDNLCRKPLGAGDYLAITDRFHTVFIEDIPVMAHADRNAVKRFIALIDTLYDTGKTLIVSAQARPSALYPVDHGTEAFEFNRTISRLREMQGDQWLAGQRADSTS